MLKDREKAIEHVRKLLDNSTSDKGNAQELVDKLIKQHNMPATYAANIGLMRKPLDELTMVDLFCIMDVINGKTSYSRYFTAKEIEEFKDYQYESIKPLDTLTFDMIQIAENQYIGKYTARQLMDLQKRSLINYNVNTQRAMKYIIRNGEEEFRIAINPKAVAAIKEVMEKKLYIPTTITLNINDESDMEMSYEDVEEKDEDGRVITKKKLVIKHVQPFDIIDGYHRYLAMSELVNTDDNFDYPMELRIVSFSEKRAKQFIYQEDQKTKMPKVASNSLNQHNDFNNVCNRLNEDSVFFGQIRMNGNINAGVLASAMRSVFVINKRSDIAEITKTFSKYFEKLEDKRPDIIEHKWSNYQVLAITYCVYKEVDIKKALKVFDHYKKPPKDMRPQYWTLRKAEQKAIEEVLKNV